MESPQNNEDNCITIGGGGGGGFSLFSSSWGNDPTRLSTRHRWSLRNCSGGQGIQDQNAGQKCADEKWRGKERAQKRWEESWSTLAMSSSPWKMFPLFRVLGGVFMMWVLFFGCHMISLRTYSMRQNDFFNFNLVPININTIIKLIVCLSLTSHVLKSFKFTSSDLLMIILMLPNLSNKEKTPSPRPPRALGSSMSVPQLRATVEVRPRTRALELPFQLSSRVENYVDLRKRQKTV